MKSKYKNYYYERYKKGKHTYKLVATAMKKEKKNYSNECKHFCIHLIRTKKFNDQILARFYARVTCQM